MVPEVRQPESLADYLYQHLNLSPEFEASGLNVEQVASVAMLAMAHSDGYAATARLVSLMAGLPLPSGEPRGFWFRLWRASGSAIFMPANIDHQVLRALRGDGGGLADQLLTAVSEMTPEERAAAAVVIGEGLEEKGLGGYKSAVLGDLWLRDVEATAWRMLYAARKRYTSEDQREFREGWKLA